MNELNQVLLEGVVTLVKPIADGTSRLFVVKSKRNFTSGDGKKKLEISTFKVEAFGEVAEHCQGIEEGARVRLTGHLKQYKTASAFEVRIVAEHIEEKPHGNTGAEKDSGTAGVRSADF